MRVDRFQQIVPMAYKMAKYFNEPFEKYEYAINSNYMAAIADFWIDVKTIDIENVVLSLQNRTKEGKRYNMIPKAILSIVKNIDCMNDNDDVIYKYFFDNKKDRKFISQAIDASTALKYVMRTYHKVEAEDE